MKQIQKAPPKGSIERIADLERQVGQLVSAINQALSQFQNELNKTNSVVMAIKEHVGSDAVDAVNAEQVKRDQLQKAEAARRWVEERVAAGTLVTVDEVGPDTVIVGVETDKDGNQLGAGRLQLHYDAVRPDIQEAITGKGPGYMCATGPDSMLEILEIYKLAQPASTVAA